jgi:hypothetical protein
VEGIANLPVGWTYVLLVPLKVVIATHRMLIGGGILMAGGVLLIGIRLVIHPFEI